MFCPEINHFYSVIPVQYRSYTNVLNIDKDIVPDLRYKIVTCEYIINLNSFFNIVMEYLMYISMKMGLTVMFQAGFVLVQTIALGSFSQIFGGTIPQKLI